MPVYIYVVSLKPDAVCKTEHNVLINISCYSGNKILKCVHILSVMRNMKPGVVGGDCDLTPANSVKTYPGYERSLRLLVNPTCSPNLKSF